MANFEFKDGVAIINDTVVELDNLEWNEEDCGFSESDIKSVVIPSSVKKICDGAFLDWECLISLEIPDTVEVIGANAFAGCRALTNLTLSKETI